MSGKNYQKGSRITSITFSKREEEFHDESSKILRGVQDYVDNVFEERRKTSRRVVENYQRGSQDYVDNVFEVRRIPRRVENYPKGTGLRR